eukprot:CAMPEP_0171626648 /NCGR_PEP_ID=MMETSP0990-20121206/20191_1 /TAXON_ID=483369 /ORGANISM="non described non described, Strain CCMP2098" /LENGTH=104 /DNA_ID=CAMNT_0012194131 /DNA_START=170 /DNA_END=485 /DNA_ORIENTATION=+
MTQQHQEAEFGCGGGVCPYLQGRLVARQVNVVSKVKSEFPEGGGAGGGASDGVPQVLDYVAQKAEMFDLQQVLKTWDRKLEIMEMAAKRAKQLKRQQRTTGFRG